MSLGLNSWSLVIRIFLSSWYSEGIFLMRLSSPIPRRKEETILVLAVSQVSLTQNHPYAQMTCFWCHILPPLTPNNVDGHHILHHKALVGKNF